jgi:cytochrome o ubiquinol oxidase operon protein cyoD
MIDGHHGWNRSYKPQFIGFVSSLIVILALYRIVTHYELTQIRLLLTVVGLASIQAIIQFFFFLHLGMESKPKWGTISFLFTVLTLVIIIGGSLWIMKSLNYDLMPTMSH